MARAAANAASEIALHAVQLIELRSCRTHRLRKNSGTTAILSFVIASAISRL